MESDEYQPAEEFFSGDSSLESREEYQVAEDSNSNEDNDDGFVFDDQIFTTPPRGVQVRITEGVLESKCCGSNCLKFIRGLGEEVKDEYVDIFSGSRIVQKNKVLQHLRSTGEVHMEMADSNHNYFFFQQTKVCPRAFSEVTKISVYLLNTVRSDFNRGRTAEYEHGNRERGRLTQAGSIFLSWMVDFSERYAQASPDEMLIILPKIFIVTELYRIYEREVGGPKVKKNSFYKLFKTHFGPNRRSKDLPRIRISNYTSHAKCDVCVNLIEARKMIRTVEDLVSVRQQTERHRKEYSDARIEINRTMQLCQSLPRDHLGLEVDDMDNSKSMLPRNVEKSKSLVGMRTLKTKISGVIIKSGLYETGRKTKFHLNHDQFENGPDKTVTLIYLGLLTFLQDHKFLPSTLVIGADNCWRKGANVNCYFN